jgi:phenylpyruvate tautomerase
MPCLELSTNTRIADKSALMRGLSDCVCTGLGKAETYMMVIVQDEVPMLFGGSEEPVAYLTLRALNLKPEAISVLAGELTRLMQERLGIESQRVYIVFVDADAGKWAWDGRAFA